MRSLSFLRTLNRNPPRIPNPRVRVPLRPISSSHGSLATMATAPASGKGSLAKRLWAESKREATFAKYTPFVLSLAAGTLEVEPYRGYIAQDVHFLRAFAHAYEVVKECTGDVDAKIMISELKKAVLEELKLHDSVAKEWGIDVRKEIIPNSATVKYTDFLQSTALGMVDGIGTLSEMTTPPKTKIPAYTIGAMTPCMRLYAFLGLELRAFLQFDEDDHPYRQWIEIYSNDSFEASALQIENLLDILSVSLIGDEINTVQKLYNEAMRLEIEFFSAQPVQQSIIPLIRSCEPTQRHVAVFSDFDLTCTLVDSCYVLSEIAISAATAAEKTGHAHVNVKQYAENLKNSWDALSSQYIMEYEQCTKSILTSKEDEAFNYEGLYKALKKISEFEKVANSRVFESRLLKGLKLDEIKREGQHLVLHNGCIDFFEKLVKDKLNTDLHIISVCWCGDLIRAAFSAGGLDHLKIHSNELCFEGSTSTGEITKKLESPLDKARTLKNILKSKDPNKTLSIYIGDSLGDLLCLLEADVGIVIGSNASLRRVATHFGVSFFPLFHGLVSKQKQLSQGVLPVWKGSSGVLYTVSSWVEIHAFVLGAEYA